MNHSITRLLGFTALMWIVSPAAMAANCGESQVGFLQHGRLVVRPLHTTTVHPATALERRFWQQSSSRLQIISPNGRYMAEQNGYRVFITDQVSHATVLTMDQVDQGARHDFIGFTTFAGWLPDGRHFMIADMDSNTSAASYRRCIEDLSGRVISFNGWLSADERAAIVPAGDGLLFDQQFYIRDDTGWHGLRPSHLRFYTAVVPRPLERYRFAAAKRFVLHRVNKPFQLDLAGAQVTFSPDDRWAIVDGHSLVDLSSGSVTDLAGTQARFVPDSSEQAAENGANLIVAGVRLGKVRLGMSRAQVHRLLGIPRGTIRRLPHGVGERWNRLPVPEGRDTSEIDVIYDARGSVVQIEAWSTSYHTRNGLGLASHWENLSSLGHFQQRAFDCGSGDGSYNMDLDDDVKAGLGCMLYPEERLMPQYIVIHPPGVPTMVPPDYR